MKITRNLLIKFIAVIALSTSSVSAFAGGHAILYGIDATDDSRYIYGGLIKPFGANSSLDGEGWRARLWLYDLNYDYERYFNQRDIDADANGLEIGVGKQWVSGKTKSSLFISLAYRDTDTSPEDTESSIEGGDTGLKVQGEITSQVSEKWMLQAMGSYTGGDDFDDTWVRLRAGYDMGTVTIGPEITGLDGPDFNASRVGIFVDGFKLGSSTSLGFSVGTHDGSRNNSTGYFNVGLSTRF